MAENFFDQYDAPNPDAAADAEIPAHPVVGPATPSYSGWDAMTDLKHFGQTALANAAGNVGATPRALAQGVDWLGRNVPPLVGQPAMDLGADAKLAGLKQSDLSSHAPHPERQLFPESKTIRDAVFASGDMPEYAPQTRLGRDALAGATLAAGSVVGGPRAALGGLLGGAGANEGAQLLPDHPMIGGTVGLGLGLLGGGALTSGVQRGASALVGGPTNETYGAFQRLGLPTQLSGTATGNEGLQGMQNLARNSAGSTAKMAKAQDTLLNGWQDAVGRTADSMGSAATQQELGAAAQLAARNWQNSHTANMKGLWQTALDEATKDPHSAAAQAAVKAAHAATDAGKDVLDQHIAPILSASTPEQAASSLLAAGRAGGSKFDAVVTAMPELRGELGSYFLRNLAGGENASPSTFLNAMRRRRQLSPEAQSVIFPSEVQQSMADLSTTARAIKPLENATANHKALLPSWFRIGEAAKAGHDVGGPMGALAAGAAAAVMPMATGKAANLVLNPAMSSIAGRAIPLEAASPGAVPTAQFLRNLPYPSNGTQAPNFFDQFDEKAP